MEARCDQLTTEPWVGLLFPLGPQSPRPVNAGVLHGFICTFSYNGTLRKYKVVHWESHFCPLDFIFTYKCRQNFITAGQCPPPNKQRLLRQRSTKNGQTRVGPFLRVQADTPPQGHLPLRQRRFQNYWPITFQHIVDNLLTYGLIVKVRVFVSLQLDGLKQHKFMVL